MSPNSVNHVVIIGAGVGGLALAQGLRKLGLSFKIYERSSPDDVRAQGYRIRIHSEGLSALRSVLEDEAWQLFVETCPETLLSPLPNINAITCEFTTANFDGNNPQSKMAQSDQRPYTVDRAILREVLLTGLDAYISFGKEYSHYDITESGVTAHFADGTSEAGSLIVGADGARSAVRRQYLPQLRLLDTKSRPIYGKTPLTTSLTSRMLAKAMDCLSLIKDPQTESVTLMEVMRFLPKTHRKDKRDIPNDYVYWVIIPPANSCGLMERRADHTNGLQSAELAKTLTAHWHPRLKPLIEDQDVSQTGVFRLLSADPEALSRGWEANARVTILGDAAHAMMPSTASGAVTALKDAGLLMGLLQKYGVGIESVERYEEEMRKYASEAVATSARIGQVSFGFGALADAEEVRW